MLLLVRAVWLMYVDGAADRVMELMYASSYRDSAKLRAADGLSSAGSSRAAGKIGASVRVASMCML